MSATTAKQGGWVQLEQCDMRLALNMTKTSKGGFLHAAIEETQFLIKKPGVEVREEKMWGVEFPWHKMVKAAMKTHPAMIRENQMDGCLSCLNGTAYNLQKGRRRNGMGAPPQERLRQPTLELTPHPPETPPVTPSNKEVAHLSEIEGVPPRYVYIRTPLPSA